MGFDDLYSSPGIFVPVMKTLAFWFVLCECISFIRTLGTHNNKIIKLHHVTHTHSISTDISLIVKSRQEISLFRTRSNSFTDCASRVTSTVLHG